jgi:sn-glycerol 3-phosphate transport system permease protein
VPAGLVLGVVLAVVANRRLKGIKVFHTIFSSTVATSVAVASVIFFVLINPTTGYFNDVGFISLSDPDSALRGVALSSIWGNLGLTFIIVLAGLQTVPDELMEAATLDGFGPLRRFFKVTLPLLSPTLLFLVVVLTIFAFQAFGQIDILTNGGPAESTETLVFKIFHSQQPVDLGVGAVMAVGLFFVTFVVTLGQFLILDRRVHYGGD